MTMSFEEYEAYMQSLVAIADKQKGEKIVVRKKNVTKKASALKLKLFTPYKPKRNSHAAK